MPAKDAVAALSSRKSESKFMRKWLTRDAGFRALNARQHRAAARDVNGTGVGRSPMWGLQGMAAPEGRRPKTVVASYAACGYVPRTIAPSARLRWLPAGAIRQKLPAAEDFGLPRDHHRTSSWGIIHMRSPGTPLQGAQRASSPPSRLAQATLLPNPHNDCDSSKSRLDAHGRQRGTTRNFD